MVCGGVRAAGVPSQRGGPEAGSARRALTLCCRRPAALGEDGGGGLAEALGEFDAVLAEFSCPAGRRRFHYGEHLERMKRRSSASVSDGSGLSDSESECPSVRPSVPAVPRPRGWGGCQKRVLNQRVPLLERGRDHQRRNTAFLIKKKKTQKKKEKTNRAFI